MQCSSSTAERERPHRAAALRTPACIRTICPILLVVRRVNDRVCRTTQTGTPSGETMSTSPRSCSSAWRSVCTSPLSPTFPSQHSEPCCLYTCVRTPFLLRSLPPPDLALPRASGPSPCDPPAHPLRQIQGRPASVGLHCTNIVPDRMPPQLRTISHSRVSLRSRTPTISPTRRLHASPMRAQARTRPQRLRSPLSAHRPMATTHLAPPPPRQRQIRRASPLAHNASPSSDSKTTRSEPSSSPSRRPLVSEATQRTAIRVVCRRPLALIPPPPKRDFAARFATTQHIRESTSVPSPRAAGRGRRRTHLDPQARARRCRRRGLTRALRGG
ncbi:hypothetical protein C8Q78DRAFT_517585 [Trametes maxima]|nr:hypothetical protein C8Q78DRAFT_517585 [Trametes maxima]